MRPTWPGRIDYEVQLVSAEFSSKQLSVFNEFGFFIDDKLKANLTPNEIFCLLQNLAEPVTLFFDKKEYVFKISNVE